MPLPAVILVRPSEEGNVGSVARAMANMGLEELILVEPAVDVGDAARALATHCGQPILAGARRAPSLAAALAPFRRAVGTTSARGARVLAVAPLAPRELPPVLARDPAGTPTALIFGPERSGLEREELARLSPIVTVPCATENPTLNLAQSVLLVAYELRLAEMAGSGAGHSVLPAGDSPAPAAELDAFMAQFEAILSRVGFERNTTFPGVVRDLRQLFARARPTDREVAMLRGACRRIERAIE
jgi:TrmH family RNA methyltransferase